MKRYGFLAALLLAAAPALAQSDSTFPGDVPNNMRFHIGAIWAFLDSSTTFSTPSVPGQEIDFTKVFGQPGHKFSFRGDGYWNFLGRSFLDFGYVSFDTKGSRAISQDIHFGGVTYTAGAQVDSESYSRFIGAAYRYEFVKTPGLQVGGSIGLAYTTLRSTASAAAGVLDSNGVPIVGQTTTKEAEINLPVPLLGLSFDAQITGPMSVGASIQALGGSIHPYSGHVVTGQAHLEYFFVRNFGMGAAYEYTTIELKKTTDTKVIQANYRYDGPRIYAVITF
jgi:hypothetical protein